MLTQKVKSFLLRQTCKFLEYKAVDSHCISCYTFFSILQEKFISMKIIIHHCKNQKKNEAQSMILTKNTQKFGNNV